MPGLPLSVSVSGQDPAKEMDLGGSPAVFDLEVHRTLGVALVQFVAAHGLVLRSLRC